MTWIKCYRHGLGGDFAFRFVDDSPLEEDGFEPSVPPEKGRTSSRCSTVPALPFPRGTEGSNPSSSTGESANHRSLSGGHHGCRNVEIGKDQLGFLVVGALR